jgi:hypothetical protein
VQANFRTRLGADDVAPIHICKERPCPSLGRTFLAMAPPTSRLSTSTSQRTRLWKTHLSVMAHVPRASAIVLLMRVGTRAASPQETVRLCLVG